MITCPCDLYPLAPHFYIVKLGFTGVYIFLFFALKHRLRVLVRNMYPQPMFLAKIRIQKFELEILFFTTNKISCILNGHVCVMGYGLMVHILYLTGM